MTPALLAIDIGTSACKAAAFAPDGRLIASATASYAVRRPQTGWAEQDAEDWWRAARDAVREIVGEDVERGGDAGACGANADGRGGDAGAYCANADGRGGDAGACGGDARSRANGRAQPRVHPADIAAIGVDGQSWAVVPTNCRDGATCDVPIWLDARATAECAQIARARGADAAFALCGNPIQPGYALPKALWLKANRPDAFARADRLLSSNGYVVWRLTGEMTGDVSQGYGWHCFDMRARRFDGAAARAFGLDASLLPEALPCSRVVGSVTRDAARETGLRAGTPVVAGGLDAACAALGVGVLDAGQTQEQGGQAGGMSICLREYAADPRLILGAHVVPERWLLQGGTTGGGGALRWLRDTLCPELSFAQMSELAERAPAGSGGVLFLPYLAGERSPLWQPSARGVFFGLEYGVGRAELIRACMEGVAYSLRHNLDTAEAAGARADTLRAMGGAANSRVWTQIKCDVTRRRVEVPGSDEATALGAAMLAGVGAGVFADFAQAVRETVSVRRVHEPNPRAAAVYEAGYRRYLELAERVLPMMAEGDAGDGGRI